MTSLEEMFDICAQQQSAALAQLYEQVMGATPPVPEPSPEMPPADKIVRCSSADQFRNEYGKAVGGVRLVVANGVAIDIGALDRPGANPEKPIVVCAEGEMPSMNSANFGKDMTMPKPYNYVWGVRLMGKKLSVNGTGCVIRRVLAKDAKLKSGSTHPGQIVLNGLDQRIEYMTLQNPDCRGIRTETECKRPKILFSEFLDFVQHDTAQVYEPIQLGEGANTFRKFTNPTESGELGWCYAENCNQNNSENECPSLKEPFWVIHDYHIHNAKNVQLRFARNARLILVRVSGNGFFGIQGPDHYFENCWAENSTGFRFFMGNWNSDKAGNPPSGSGSAPAQYPSVLRPVMKGCNGNVEVGYKPANDCTLRVQELKIEAMQGGTVKNSQGGEQAWTTQHETDITVAEPPRYRRGDWGWLSTKTA